MFLESVFIDELNKMITIFALFCHFMFSKNLKVFHAKDSNIENGCQYH